VTAHGVALFHTTSGALRAERAVLPVDPSARLVPTPRELSSDCGVALRFDWALAEAVGAALAAAHIEPAGLHQLPGRDGPGGLAPGAGSC
jgi:hypothetical protein